MKYLRINIKENAQNILAGFPFGEDQYLDQEYEDVLIVALGNAEDTTALQEQHLNMNDNVLSFRVGGE
jgi:hypothetical protein